MAVDYSKFLDVEVENIEAPKPPPVGHYHATIKSHKVAERNYDKATGGAPTPVVELTFALTSPGDDVDTDLLGEDGLKGKLVSRDYRLSGDDGAGLHQLRKLGEETCGLAVKGLRLGDMLPSLIGQEVQVYVEHRAGSEEGQLFTQVKKVLPASGEAEAPRRRARS